MRLGSVKHCTICTVVKDIWFWCLNSNKNLIKNLKILLCQYFYILQQSGKVFVFYTVVRSLNISVPQLHCFFIRKMYCKVEQKHILFSSTLEEFQTFNEGKIWCLFILTFWEVIVSMVFIIFLKIEHDF